MTAKRRILAVDDAPANLVALDAVLGRQYELIAAHSGQEALGILAKDPNIDVILLDIQMPVMDGYEVASRIKKIPECADIPLIFITAIYTEDPHVKKGYELGAVDYFTKPFDPDLLRLKVDVYATFRRPRDHPQDPRAPATGVGRRPPGGSQLGRSSKVCPWHHHRRRTGARLSGERRGAAHFEVGARHRNGRVRRGSQVVGPQREHDQEREITVSRVCSRRGSRRRTRW